MTNSMTSVELRHWAAQCRAQADDHRCSGDERAKLMRMERALQELAGLQDWLEGRLNKVA